MTREIKKQIMMIMINLAILLCIFISSSAFSIRTSKNLQKFSVSPVHFNRNVLTCTAASATKLLAKDNRKITREDEGDFFVSEVNVFFLKMSTFVVLLLLL